MKRTSLGTLILLYILVISRLVNFSGGLVKFKGRKLLLLFLFKMGNFRCSNNSFELLRTQMRIQRKGTVDPSDNCQGWGPSGYLIGRRGGPRAVLLKYM